MVHRNSQSWCTTLPHTQSCCWSPRWHSWPSCKKNSVHHIMNSGKFVQKIRVSNLEKSPGQKLISYDVSPLFYYYPGCRHHSGSERKPWIRLYLGWTHPLPQNVMSRNFHILIIFIWIACSKHLQRKQCRK